MWDNISYIFIIKADCVYLKGFFLSFLFFLRFMIIQLSKSIVKKVLSVPYCIIIETSGADRHRSRHTGHLKYKSIGKLAIDILDQWIPSISALFFILPV